MPLTRRHLLASTLPAVFAAGAERGFAARLLPAPLDGGFAMEGYWVWCGSAIRGPEGRYHLFASRWPRALPLATHWLTNSEVVRAESPKPEGPYRFAEVVLPARGENFWDGRSTHNPTIHHWRGLYLLFYTGSTYRGQTPAPGRFASEEMRLEARANQLVGVAVAKSLRGPWQRLDKPLIEPRPGQWDGFMTNNPAPCVHGDGSVLLIYKSARNPQGLLHLGAARAPRWDGPYRRLKDSPLFDFSATGDHVEDAYVWREGGRYHLLMKDMRGGICGERGAGVHATSPDGVDWTVSRPALAYSRHVLWSDGVVREQRKLERPQLLIENGRPTHLFLATATGPRNAPEERSWNMVIPLSAAGAGPHSG